MKDLAGFLSTKLHFLLFTDKERLKQAILLIEMRNLFVHNRGIINRLFLERVPDYKGEVGHLLEVSDQDVVSAVDFLSVSAMDIDARAILKFGLPSAPPDEHVSFLRRDEELSLTP